MLVHLRIRDFAIIDAAEVQLPAGFTVVTGETGAGKSILVDALSLALGGRARSDVVRDGATCAEVEALFDITGQSRIAARLQARELVGDDPDTLLVQRVIGVRGRGKVVINGHLSTVATLLQLVRGLVDISGQHEQQSLLWVENHLDILDSFAGTTALRERYKQGYRALFALQTEARRLHEGQAEAQARFEYVRFLLDEIAGVAPQPDEDQALEAEAALLRHAEKLRDGAVAAEALLYGEDGSAFDKLGRAHSELVSLARIDAALQPTCDALSHARREIEDAARSVQRYATRVDCDPRRLEDVQSRLSELQRLARKHGGALADVLRRQGELGAEAAALEGRGEGQHSAQGRLQEAKRGALAQARALSAARSAAASRLSTAVEAEVAEMDLPQARYVVAQQPYTGDGCPVDGCVLGPDGIDAVEFLWSANRGETPKPLARIASGGELSRLMLAVKGVLCERDLVSIYVFDEVDTGLGGAAADSIGRKIARVAREHQALTITHLAPIAARAAHHLRVHKQERLEGTRGKTQARTVSKLQVVQGTARAEEIARMIDGGNISAATRAAAKAMLARSSRAKGSQARRVATPQKSAAS